MSSQRALLLALIATFFFSSAPAGVRAVSQDAYGLGIIRLSLASLGMTLILGIKGNHAPWKIDWTPRVCKALFTVGITFGLHWLLFFLSIKTANSSIGAIGYSTYGIHLLLLGGLLGYGTISAIDIASLVVALLGTWLLMPEIDLENNLTLGLLIGVLSGLAAAFLPIWHQRYADVDGNLRAWGQFTFALPVFICTLPWSTWNVPAEDLPVLLYIGLVVTLCGHALWVHASTALSTTTTSIISYLYLPCALFFGYFLLDEKLSGRMLIGALCIFAANGIALWSQSRRGGLGALAKNIEND